MYGSGSQDFLLRDSHIQRKSGLHTNLRVPSEGRGETLQVDHFLLALLIFVRLSKNLAHQ